MKLYLTIILLCLSIGTLWAQQPLYEGPFSAEQPLREYFAAENQNFNKSIIYIFYNNNPCEECAQTIALTEEIYNTWYADRYAMFVIDWADDEEYDFIEAYDLNAPLSIVLVRIQDGASFGYRKIDNPQNIYDTPEDYTRYLTEQINSFLGDF